MLLFLTLCYKDSLFHKRFFFVKMYHCGLKTTFRDLWACCFSLSLRGSLRWNFKLGSNFVTPHWVHDIIKGTFQRPKACLCQSSSNLKRRLNDSTKKSSKNPFEIWSLPTNFCEEGVKIEKALIMMFQVVEDFQSGVGDHMHTKNIWAKWSVDPLN